MNTCLLPENLIEALTRLEGKVVKWRANKLKGTVEGSIFPLCGSKIVQSIVKPSSGVPQSIATGHCTFMLEEILPTIQVQAEKGNPIDTILLGERQRDLHAELVDTANSRTNVDDALARMKRFATWELSNTQESNLAVRGALLYDWAQAKCLLPDGDTAALLEIGEAQYELDLALSNLSIDPDKARLVKGSIVTKIGDVILETPKPLPNYVVGDKLVELLNHERQQYLFEGDYETWSALCVALLKLHINLATRRVLPSSAESSDERLERYKTLLEGCPKLLNDPGLDCEMFKGINDHISALAHTNLAWYRPLPVVPLGPMLPKGSERVIARVVATRSSTPSISNPIDDLIVYLRPFMAIKDLFRIFRGISGTPSEEDELLTQLKKCISSAFWPAFVSKTLAERGIGYGEHIYYEVLIPEDSLYLGKPVSVEGRFLKG